MLLDEPTFVGESSVVWFEGNYEDYEVDKKKRLGAAGATPHPIRYKSLTRRWPSRAPSAQ